MAEGGALLEAAKRLFQETNARPIVIEQGADTVVEFPLAVGVAGALVAPWLAAAGAIAAIISDRSSASASRGRTRSRIGQLPRVRRKAWSCGTWNTAGAGGWASARSGSGASGWSSTEPS